MENLIKQTARMLLLSFAVLFLFASCRSEEFTNISENNSVLETNSKVADFLKRISLNDGSNDNILDLANCFDIKLPVTVVANGTTVSIDSEDDIDIVEAIFNEFDTDTDVLEINFPITVIFSDYSETFVNSQSELNALSVSCNGENEDDDDIECLDFLYPISFSVFNTITEQTSTININNDNQLHRFIEDLDNDNVATMNFPITLVLSDGSQQMVNSLDELETAIDAVKDDCDEDDDYDFDDDDCVDCTTTQVSDILTTCSDWIVDKLEQNDNNDLEDLYEGFTFNFATDGTISVQDGATNHSGTWSTSGSGNTLRLMLVISTLPDFNGNWFVHEIEEDDETKVDLRLGNRRLRFESTCN